MKLLRGGFLALLSSILFASSTFAAVLDVVEPPIEYYAPVYITAFQVSSLDDLSSQLDAVELHNPTSDVVSLHGWTLEARDEYGALCQLALGDYIEPDGFVVLARAGLFAMETVREFEPNCLQEGRIVSALVLISADGRQEIVGDIEVSGAWVRKNTTKTYRSGLFSKDFEPMDDSSRTILYAGAWYRPLSETAIEIVEILPRALDCSPLQVGPECFDFVKLHNPTLSSVMLDGLRLRIGNAGQKNPTTSNAIVLSGELPAGGYGAVTTKADGSQLAITNDGGWVWLEDHHGVLRYDDTVVEYPSASSASKQGMSWMYDSQQGEWAWTSTPTAGGMPSQMYIPANEALESAVTTTPELQPCAAGQYRNPATNRCKKIETSTSQLKPCGPGEFRNPETNRCKKLASTASSTLEPCGPGEYRNPATNRCKKLASSTSTLKPCEPGYERNPETNRCRKVLGATTATPAAAFAVEPFEQSARSVAGWWALGVVTLLGLVYAAWEWRFELRRWLLHNGKRGDA